MWRRKHHIKHAELARVELGESLDHAMRAAGHAAGGVRTTVGPRVAPAAQRVRAVAADRWDSTRAALAPLSEAALGDSKRSRKQGMKGKLRGGRPEQGRRQWPALVGLLAGGVAVGVAVAAVVRRSREQEWQEYDAAPGEELPAT